MKLSSLLFAGALALGCAPVEPEDGIHTQCVPNAAGGWMASTDVSITSCGPNQRVSCLSDHPLPGNRVLGICCGTALTNEQANACVTHSLANTPAVSDAGRRD